MQVTYFEYWTNRVLYYLSKIYTGQVKTGDPYDMVKPCIHVSILDFIYFPEDAKCCRKIAFFDTENGKQYTDLMESYILELKKLPPEAQSEKGILRWMRFLHGKNRKEFEYMAEKDEYIREAYDTLVKMSADEKKQMEYEAREKALRDYQSQMQSAENAGFRKVQLRNVKR